MLVCWKVLKKFRKKPPWVNNTPVICTEHNIYANESYKYYLSLLYLIVKQIFLKITVLLSSEIEFLTSQYDLQALFQEWGSKHLYITISQSQS